MKSLLSQINTIDEKQESVLKDKKSTFIASVYPVTTEEEVKENLSAAKKKYHHATHHCYAFKLANGMVHYSDGGEPKGTAGPRILKAIEHFNLFNQLVIVTRFFGGIKLGVGPLGKAYYKSAFQVLEDSEIKTKQLFQKVIISSDFNYLSRIHQILSNHKSFIQTTQYQENVKLDCLIKPCNIEIISEKLSELSKNTVTLKPYLEFYYK